MAMNLNPSLGDLVARGRISPAAQIQIAINKIENYHDFLNVIYRALDMSIRALVMNRKYNQGLSEDQITVQIVTNFRMLGISTATHDTDIGGHVDIAVELDDNYLWLAEAKKWGGCSWIMKGYKQLLTRYATGLPNQDHGALLIYFFESDAQTLMQKWFSQIKSKYKILSNLKNVAFLQFDSTQTHRGAGSDYYIRHIGVPLYWKPE